MSPVNRSEKAGGPREGMSAAVWRLDTQPRYSHLPFAL